MVNLECRNSNSIDQWVPVREACIELENVAAFSSTFGAAGIAAALRRKGFEDENCEVIVFSSICQGQKQKSLLVE